MFIQRIKSQLRKHYVFVQTISLKKTLFKKRTIVPSLQLVPSYSKASSGGRSIVKNFYYLFAAMATLVFASCQKDKLNDTVLNTTTTSSSAQARIGLPFFHRDPVTYYGALIGSPELSDDVDFQLNVGDQLGISCLRERVTVPLQSLGNNLVPELNTSYNVLLNFNSPGSGGQGIPFVSDLNQYKTDLNTVLNSFLVMPVVAVIENEESNRFYYYGSANEYIDQLNTAIGVMHARGIKVANGGITSTGLCYLVYQDLLAQGKEDAALQFQQLTNVTPNSGITQERGAFVDVLLTNYAKMDLDYVNFHWKGTSPDTQALSEVIDYLKKRTGKKIISNELGQFDTDPNTLLTHVQLCTDENFPYIIWYSPDESQEKKGTPLQHSNASLTSSGFAYQDYLEN